MQTTDLLRKSVQVAFQSKFIPQFHLFAHLFDLLLTQVLTLLFRVMLAEHIETGEKVALKVMKNGKSHQKSSDDNMFNDEVCVLKDLVHPNILGYKDHCNNFKVTNAFGKLIQVKFIALEYAENGEFFEYLATEERMSEEVVRYFFHTIIDAIEYMHTQGYAHRDIKPENMLVDKEFNLKFADFGFSTKEKIIGGRRGTLGYMAPEVHAGIEHDPKKADLFSIAVILFIMMTQHCPFTKAIPSDKYYKAVMGSDIDQFWQLHSNSNGKQKEFSDSFKTLFGGMIAMRPEDRLTINDIKESEWYNLPVATPEEAKAHLKKAREVELSLFGNSENVSEKEVCSESQQKCSKASRTTKSIQEESGKDVIMRRNSDQEYITKYVQVTDPEILVDAVAWF